MNSKVFVLLSLLLLFTVAVVQAQDDEPAEVEGAEDTALTCDHPRVDYLAEKTGAECEDILALHADGVGFGRIMKAAVIAEGVNEDWQTLLNAHREGTGWGELGMAYGLKKQFAGFDADPADLLELKASGLGWGQIKKIYALSASDLDITQEEAEEMVRGGMGWGQIKAELDLEPGGPPPWAGGPHKDKFEDGNHPGKGRGNGLGNGQGKGAGD